MRIKSFPEISCISYMPHKRGNAQRCFGITATQNGTCFTVHILNKHSPKMHTFVTDKMSLDTLLHVVYT